MNNRTVAKRYAAAIFELAEDNGQTETIAKELGEAASIIYDNDDLRTVWEELRFAHSDRVNVIKKIFTKDYSVTLVNFLLLLIEKRRTNYLLDIVKEYSVLLDAKQGISDALVVSAYSLSDEELERIGKTLGQSLNQQLRLEQKVDESLLAGIQVYYKDYVIDGSLKARLERMRKELVTRKELRR